MATASSGNGQALAPLQKPEAFTLVLFGGTGDLAARKLFPSLFALWHTKLLPERWALVGLGRRPLGDAAFRKSVGEALARAKKDGDANEFLAHVHYLPCDVSDAADFDQLRVGLEALEQQGQAPANRLFYLAVDPQFFRPIVSGLAAAGLTRHPKAWARIVIEKPFGHDLESARALDDELLRHLHPDQLYLIDHYLGKDTVQNLLAFRFGNAIFEPLFRRECVSHVEITVAETVGMEGKRGSYYDTAGAMRDVTQNHLLQLLAFVAMEAPATLKARDIKDAKLQTLRNLVPIREEDVCRKVVRAQYREGKIDSAPVRGYLNEEGVKPDSTTETYVALRAEVDNWRWAGVPFLLRTGKRLARRATEIAVHFKLPPLKLFRTLECAGDVCNLTQTQANILAFRIQPNEGIALEFSAKRPGMTLDLSTARMAFDYSDTFGGELPEAYERLLFDAMRGDTTLFMRADELEAAWEFITPILNDWAQEPQRGLATYPAGSWGPAEADALARGCQGSWRKP